ncbi:acyl-CoA N-acyltransferase [Xylariaceae sp. AK1471]|nr:acyl-CoA N-acyltransferase [Xylariaceae sp. AK1471]
MDSMTAAFKGAFRSKRLVYNAINYDEGDMSYIFNRLRSDPVSSALASSALHWGPFSRATSDEKAKSQKDDALLSVLIGASGSYTQTIGTLHITENSGYGTEAINWAMDWSFRWAGVHSLVVEVAAYNERAIAVFKKAGFKQEGVSREVIYRDRKWHDVVQLAILEHEWEALRSINTDKPSA